MAFWNEPSNHMIERERRLLFVNSRHNRPLTLGEREQQIDIPDSQTSVSIELCEATEEESQSEASNLRFQSKEKLLLLGQYVTNHVFRKIRAKWPNIRAAFNSKDVFKRPSISFRGEKTADASPSPRKRSGTKLPLSSLIALICTDSGHINLLETLEVFKGLVGADNISLLVSSKIFAMETENDLFGDIDMNMIHQMHEVKVNDEELMNILFSAEKETREMEIDQSEKDHQLILTEKLEMERKIRLVDDKSKARAIKNNVLFETAMGEIQPSKGPVTGSRLNKLFRMIATCSRSLYQQRVDEATVIINRHRHLLELIGMEYFSDRYISFIQSPPFIPPPSWIGDDSDQIPPPSIIHSLSLYGPPSLLYICKTLISLGKGLNGLSYYEVAELLQAFAATKIQTKFRMHARYWSFSAARRLWRVRHYEMRKSHFFSWSKYTRMICSYRKYCLRKIIAWMYYTKECIRKRELFCACFWPIYVWRKYAAASATANEKAKFLVTRVYPTYLQIHVFRAWKSLAQDIIGKKRRADDHYKSFQHGRLHISFLWLRKWASNHASLRKSWVKTRLYEEQMRPILNKLSYFQIWQGYAMYRSAIKTRVKVIAPEFRRRLMHDKLPTNAYEKYYSEHKATAERKRAKRKQFLAEIAHKRLKIQRMSARFEAQGGRDARLFSGQELDDDIEEEDLEDLSESDSTTTTAAVQDTAHGDVPQGSAAAVTAAASVASSSTTRREDIRVMSNWRVYRAPASYDIDSEGPFDAEVPDKLRSLYEQCLSPLSELEYEQSWASNFVTSKYENLAYKFTTVEIWALLEESMVFHRAASKAFRNLQLSAIIRRNARRSALLYKHKILRRIFNALYQWMHRDDAEYKSDAEALALLARNKRMENLSRRRHLQKQALLSMQGDASAIPLDSNGGGGGGIVVGDLGIDLLELDRVERDDEIKQIKTMIALSNSYQQHIDIVVSRNVIEIGKEEIDMKKKVVADIFVEENALTLAAKETELSFARNFRLNAIKVLVDTLYRVYTAASKQYSMTIVKISFRQLRVPLLKRRSIYMRNRAILKNYIRICKRLVSLADCVYRYRDKRSVWVAYNRWLKLIELSYLDTSPGLIPRIKRAVEMYKGFSAHLKELGCRVLVYPKNGTLLPMSLEFRSIFLRWKMLTQEEKMFRVADEKASILYDVKLVRHCFHLMKYARREYVIRLVPEVTKCPALVRAAMDLDQIIKRFVAVRKVNLFTRVRILNCQFQRHMMNAAKKAMTYKGFLRQLNDEVNRRLATEMAVLSDAFEERGTLGFIDTLYAAGVPDTMLRLPGTLFCDPVLELEFPMVPGGYKLSSLILCLQETDGIVGWQNIWRADAAPDISGPRRGKWSGAALDVEEFIIPPHDFIRRVEYYYEGVTIYGVRLLLYFSGWSHWIGGKNSMSSLTMALDVGESPLPPDEEHMYNFDDEADPAYMKRYVIGFTGIETLFQATGLGLVIRNVTHQHLFSYHWVDEGIYRELGKLEQKKRLDRLKKERELKLTRKLKAKISNKLSLPAIIQSQIIAKLSKNTKWQQGVAESVSQGANRAFSNSMEQYFDVTRMRSTEVQSALHRATEFSIRLWADAEIAKRADLHGMLHLKVIAGLTRWLFEVLSKRLMGSFPHAARGTQIILQSMEIHNKADADLRESANTNLNAIRLENDVNRRLWENKYLLSPEDRKLKRDYERQLAQMRTQAMEIIRNADKMDAGAYEMFKKGKALLPYLKLNKFICSNYHRKVDAARHKAVLLERMTLGEVKSSLSGGADKGSEVLTAESMVTLQNLLADKKKEKEYRALDADVQEAIREEVERVKLANTRSTARVGSGGKSTYRKLKSIPNPVDISRRKASIASSTTSNIRRQQNTKLTSLQMPSLGGGGFSNRPSIDDDDI